MPELPEVETYRRQLEKKLKNKTIKDVHVHPDKIIFAGKSPATVKKAFLGHKVTKLLRKGKYLWFEMNKDPWPVFHLGMSGSFMITDKIPPKAKSIKLILEMSDGTVMVYKDPRRFGRIFILNDPANEKPLKNLGPDAFLKLPTPKKLFEMFSTRKRAIKTLLMEQHLISGIGNWMADEILFQSKINPTRLGFDLSFSEITKIHHAIKKVTALAVKSGADDEKYPDTWLFHHRWGKRTGKVSTGDEIKHSVVGGRSTAWVPAVQK